MEYLGGGSALDLVSSLRFSFVFCREFNFCCFPILLDKQYREANFSLVGLKENLQRGELASFSGMCSLREHASGICKQISCNL